MLWDLVPGRFAQRPFCREDEQQERSFATGEQEERQPAQGLLNVKCSPESAHRPDSREIKVGKCALLQNQRLLALRSRQQRSPPTHTHTLQEEPSRTMEQGGPSPRPEGAWPSLQTPTPGLHLPGRTDLKAVKCTCSFDFPSFT